jgi:hypothetical protein
MKRSAEPPPLRHFAIPTVYPVSVSWWHTALRWSREGLVRIVPATKDTAQVSLTAKGRDQAGLPPIKGE